MTTLLQMEPRAAGDEVFEPTADFAGRTTSPGRRCCLSGINSEISAPLSKF